MPFAVKEKKVKLRETVYGEDFVYTVDSDDTVSIVRCNSSKPSLFVPRQIDGMTVRRIEEGAFSDIPTLRTLACPAHVNSIGRGAFANCTSLKKLVLPHDVHQLEANWVYGCDNLEKVVFPGTVANVSSDFFALHITCKVVFGHRTETINIPRTKDALFTQVAVDQQNPHVATDGICLFTPDFKTLIRCLVHTEDYIVPEGCIKIAEKAFAYNTVLESIHLPEGIECIGDHAFTGTGITTLECPASLLHIDSYAFSNCRKLKTVKLEEGLLELGEHSFFGCERLANVKVPSTVVKMGNCSFSRCDSLVPGDSRGLTIAPDNPRYLVDKSGVLYRKEEDGKLELVIALNRLKGNYNVRPNTVKIRKSAFDHNNELETVVFPSTLRVIGKQAFLRCTNLNKAELPEGLIEIEQEAFRLTSLREVRIPSTLQKLGNSAFITKHLDVPGSSNIGRSATIIASTIGAIRAYGVSGSRQTRREDDPHVRIEVDPQNERFWVESDFLCEQEEDGVTKAVQYCGNSKTVAVPQSVTVVEMNAFIATKKVEELAIPRTLRFVGTSGLLTQHSLKTVRIMDSAIGDIVLHPASNVAGVWAQNRAFSQQELSIRLLIQDCDESLIRMLPSIDRTSLILDRLSNGKLIDPQIRAEFRQIVLDNIDDAIRSFAHNSYLEGIAQLVDLEFINVGNIVHAVDLSSEVKGVAATNILLNAQRRMSQFNISEFDL